MSQKMRAFLIASATAALLITMPVLAPVLVSAQDNDAVDATGAVRPIANATRIGMDEAPVLDGDISDAVWSRAVAFDDFDQLEPNDGAPPTERTVVRILYDENKLYFAIYAYDSEPDRITATIKSGPSGLSSNDLIRVFLDPTASRRNSWLFEVNPLGARADAVTQNNQEFIFEWNTIWHANARIVADGWTVEMAIPFRSISYDVNRGDWGLELMRLVRRKGERIRWANGDNALFSTDVSRAGTLRTITDTAQGIGLDAKIYGSLTFERDWRPATRENDLSFEPSGNFFYKITPALTGTLTLNTDFSDTPLDGRRVNTSRFSLFFPETRDFFLQDVALFEFGGSALDDVNASPFFSRRIGLANGVPVNLNGGLKLSGTVGDLSVGALSVWADGPSGEDPRLLSVVRATMPIGESKAGFIVTNGDPVGDDDNTIAGVDFQYRNSEWIEGLTFRADLYYQRSFSALAGDDDAFAVQFSQSNEPFTFEVKAGEIGANFNPALGFVNRPGIRTLDGNFVYRHRPDDGPVRWVESGIWYLLVTNLDNEVESRENGMWAGFLTSESDSFFINLVNVEEHLDFGFFLPDGVFIPAGDYEGWQSNLDIETAEERELSWRANIGYGFFFGGTNFRLNTSINWRPTDDFSIRPSYFYSRITVPAGAVDIHIVSLDGIYDFTPDMGLVLQSQWDNISSLMGASLRYRWQYDPGSELFVALAEGAFIDERTYESIASGASIRIGHMFRL